LLGQLLLSLYLDLPATGLGAMRTPATPESGGGGDQAATAVPVARAGHAPVVARPATLAAVPRDRPTTSVVPDHRADRTNDRDGKDGDGKDGDGRDKDVRSGKQKNRKDARGGERGR
jgi:hypothetical protein